MFPLASRCAAILLIFVFGLLQAGTATGNAPVLQEIGKSDDVPAKEIALDALVFLRETEAAYQALRSYSVEFDSHVESPNPKVWNNPIAGRIAYREPDHLVYVLDGKSGLYERRTDGKHLFLLRPNLPHEYTEAPFDDKSLFSICWAAGSNGHGVTWLQILLSKSLVSDLHDSGLVSLTLGSKSIIDGVPVQNLVAVLVRYHYEGTKRIPEPVTVTFTIGTKDHLLYQVRDDYTTDIQIIRYTHPRTNPILSDSVFDPPSGALRLPLLHVLNVNENTVLLDKGSRDRVSVGDELDVYTEDNLRCKNAILRVTEVNAHDSIADIRCNTGVVSPEEACIIVAHPSPPDRQPKNTQTKPRH